MHRWLSARLHPTDTQRSPDLPEHLAGPN